MAKPNDPNAWIPEEQVADELGVTRDRARAARPYLGPGEVKREGNVVLWLRAAAARLAEKLGLTLPKKTAAAGTQVEELAVVSQPRGPDGRHFGNFQLIQARRSNGDLVIVRVAHSGKYAPKLWNGEPMILKAQQSTHGHWWLLVGREPRYRGRW